MGLLASLVAKGAPIPGHAPWPHVLVDRELWKRVSQASGDGSLVLCALFGDAAEVHLAVLEEDPCGIAIFSLPCPDGRFPSVGQYHAPAIRLERTVRDLYHLFPEDAPDLRPWLDHGRFGAGNARAYPFLTSEGPGLHQIAVGPVHAGIIEPGHFRFTANGETIVRLEARLGYAHKGVESLLRGATLDRAAKLAGRISGDSTVAYALAFARAAEAAARVTVPVRAHWLRALMAELERLANHLGDIGAICNDAAFALMHAHCGILRERILRTCDTSFGHRLMRDCVMPGGTACDLATDGVARLRTLVRDIGRELPRLIALYDNTASLQDRTVGTGRLAGDLVRQFGAGGYVGRASGRNFDARRALSYPPYDQLDFDVPVLEEGDVNARVWIRIREVQQSLNLAEQILDGLPAGPVLLDIPHRAGFGASMVEGFRGDIFAWTSLDNDGCVARCHLRDPSWFQWPLLEAAVEGNIVGDFPLCNKSFNCSYSGHDL